MKIGLCMMKFRGHELCQSVCHFFCTSSQLICGALIDSDQCHRTFFFLSGVMQIFYLISIRHTTTISCVAFLCIFMCCCFTSSIISIVYRLHYFHYCFVFFLLPPRFRLLLLLLLFLSTGQNLLLQAHYWHSMLVFNNCCQTN